MGTHVFVVDKNTFPVHRDRFFCGVKNPVDEDTRFGLYSDLFSLRIGDTVLFYQMRIDENKLERGFRGIYEVASEPFFDTDEIIGVTGSVGVLGSEGKSVIGKCQFCECAYSEEKATKQEPSARSRSGFRVVDIKKCKKCRREISYDKPILPNRVLIKSKEYYEKPVDDNTAYIDRDDMKDAKKDILWTMIFRKVYGAGRERSITPVLPNEASKLIRLVRRVNGAKKVDYPPSKPYPAAKTKNAITLGLKVNADGSLIYESMLRAWFMKNVDKKVPGLKEIVGDDLVYFGNNVLYGIGGENVDVLCIHQKKGETLPYKATVVELKKDKIDVGAVDQVTDYTKWMSQLVFSDSNRADQIQPVLIGHTVPDKIIKLVDSRTFKTKKPMLIEYTADASGIKFIQKN